MKGRHTGLALLSLLAVDCGPAEPTSARPVGAMLEVRRGTLEDHVVLTGELEASNSTEMYTPRTDAWQLSIRWMADDGTPVDKGDRLVEFDNTAIVDKIADYELTVIQAGNELATHRATGSVEVAEKKFEVDKQAVEVDKARVDAETPEDLLSRYEHRQAQLKLERAQVAHGAAKQDHSAAVSAAALDDEIKKIAYDKALRQLEAAEEQIDALVLTAPRDGVAVINNHPWEGRKYQVGDTVWPGWAVAKLPDLSKMVVKAELSDVDDGRIAVGMRAVCTIDAFPDRPLAGVVKTVSPVAHEPDRNSARRFFSVTVELDETDTEIMRPGLSVQVEVLRGRADDALLVPRAAIDLADPESPVAILADGSRAPIELELCNAQACAVNSGVAEGDSLRRADEEVEE